MHNRFEISAFSQAEMNRKHIKLTAYRTPSILKHFIRTNYLIFTTTLRRQAYLSLHLEMVKLRQGNVSFSSKVT